MLAAAVEKAFTQPSPVPNAIQRLGKLASDLLSSLYRGKKTYRSDSVRAQIAQSTQFEDLNALLQRNGLEPLLTS